MTGIFELYIALGDIAEQGRIYEIINLISDHHVQFRVIGIVEGYWKGTPEDTLVVQVFDIEVIIKRTVEALKVITQRDDIVIENIHKKFS